MFETHDAQESEAFGEHIGARLRGGEVIELSSDLGGGKTTLTRGIARGAGSVNQVASPTFTVSKLYDAGQLHIHHFDFYRLAEAGIMSQELAELLEDPTNIIIVEWSDVVQSVLPADRLTIAIQRIKSGEDHRRFVVTYPSSMAYITEGWDV